MFNWKKRKRFTKAASEALSLAQIEAERLHHQLVFPEHLLMGLMRNQDGLAGHILAECGLSEDRLRAIVEELTTAYPKSKKITGLAQETKATLEKAVDEARREGLHYLCTYHLLLGVVQQTKGTIPAIFQRIQLTPEDVYALTRHEASKYKGRFGFKKNL